MAASAPKPSDKSREPRKTLSLVQAAATLGVHRNTLSKWLDEGCPAVTRADRDRGIEWQLEIPSVVDWRIRRAVEGALASYQDDGGQITKPEADRRRAVAQAITAEVEADEALDAVVSRDNAEAVMASFCQVLKSGLGNASSKIASRAATMRSAPEIRDVCHQELNRAFDTAAAELDTMWQGKRGIDHDDADGED